MKTAHFKKSKKKSATSKNKSHSVKMRTFPIVGVGASAGGLEAFSQLLQKLPSNTGMAFVFIQHLDPTHTSLLSEALTKSTAMVVREIKDGMRIVPNEVYVILPGYDVGILSNRFSLFKRDLKSRKPNSAINFFFRSLAVEGGNRSIGVVLTGTGTDGTEGLRAIKSENGVTLSQDPSTAKYDSMPQSAVKAEVVDFCYALPELSLELVRLSQQPYFSKNLSSLDTNFKEAQDLKKIIVLLRTLANVDFSEYKLATVKRRISRRMALLRIVSVQEYIKYTQSNPEEIKALSNDILIHVTSFFRDPEIFESLKSDVFPKIIESKIIGSPIRIWVAGCSSGEEVFSIAISLLEFLGDQYIRFPIQIFGSDLSEKMISKARIGKFTDSAVAGVSSERLIRFFHKYDEGYRINSLVRELCVFVRHDLSRDPPFSRLDLITCRNVFIYFEHSLQKRIISSFHYCLNRPGFLLLGKTESILEHEKYFSTLKNKDKIFLRKSVESPYRFSKIPNSLEKSLSVKSDALEDLNNSVDIVRHVDKLLLDEFSPPGVVINEQLEIIQYRGKTGLYIEPPTGSPQLNLLKMVRDGIFLSLKGAISEAKLKGIRVKKEKVTFKNGDEILSCNLIVTPFKSGVSSRELHFLVLFEKNKNLVSSSKKGSKNKLSKDYKIEKNESQKISLLERELKDTQDYLQSINDENQRTNESLNSLNEEFISGNEELQSMNEELETAKEELQSTNEELVTVNEELQNRSHEISLINDDLVNLLNGIELPILILDINRCIRRFTPKARKILNLLQIDIGRPIQDINLNILVSDLDLQVQTVIKTFKTLESEVQDKDGKWHRLQIRPYRNSDDKISGAVISLININTLRQALIEAEWVRDYSARIVEGVQIPLLILNDKMAVIFANQVFYEDFKSNKTEVENVKFYEINNAQWNIPELRGALGEMIEKGTSFQNMEKDFSSSNNEVNVFSISARPIYLRENESGMILLAIEDITERKTRERDRRELLREAEEAKAEAEKANITKDLFLATLSHELRTPLTSMVLQAQMLGRGTLNPEKTKKACAAIERAAQKQCQLIEDLLDVSRIVTGKLKMNVSPVSVNAIIVDALEMVRSIADSRSVILEVDMDSSVCDVSGDPIRLQQIVWNLLTNAIKFSTVGEISSRVSIQLKKIENWAQIKVIDSGIGIDAEFLPLVFKRFSQAEVNNTRNYGGLGLGLAIVKHLVELHAGSVSVESKGKDQGSTFTVLLPLLKDKFSGTGSSTKKSSFPLAKKVEISSLLNGSRILIVEDDLESREALVEILKHSGADVKAAGSGDEAISILATFTPDRLVLDISMPIESGYSLLSRIRHLPKFTGTKIPALALTALASDADREEAFASGFQMYLTKPVDIEKLIKSLVELKEKDMDRVEKSKPINGTILE